MFKTFLKNHSADAKNGKPITHTRIKDAELGIHGGAYHIPEQDLPEYWKLYYDHVFVKGNKEYMTEVQNRDVGKMYLDFDFKYSPTDGDIIGHYYSNDDIDEIIDAYGDKIKKYMNVVPETFDVFVMQRDNAYRVNACNIKQRIVKDGIHVLFNVLVPRVIQIKIREDLLSDLKNNKVWENLQRPNNDWDNVLDDTIVNGTTNVQMFGSQKPKNEPYKLTHHWKFTIDPVDNVFMTEKQLINFDFNTFKDLSVQSNGISFEPSSNGLDVIEDAKPKPKKSKLKQSPTVQVGSNKLQDIAQIIREIRKHDTDFGYYYQEWTKVGWTIYNECDGGEDGELLFDTLSQEFDDDKVEKKYDAQEIKKQYYKTQEKREKKLGLKWLCDKLKEHDPDNHVFLEIASRHIKGKVKFATNDNIASDILFNELKDSFKSYKGRMFYLDKNIWITDINNINDIILQYILQSGIYYGIDDKTGKPISYAQNVSKSLKIRDALYAKIRTQNNDDELYIKFHETTKGKLCFNDGVLDLKTKQFHKWETIPKNTIFSTMKINYDYFEYHKNPNKKIIEDIKTKLFEPMFADKMDLALKFLARAMGGHCEDKRFGTYLGNRNCGKGVLYDILKFSFQDYVRTFELGNLLYCRKTAGLETLDCSKKLYWLIDLEFTRLAISQEIPDCKSGLVVNGGLFKKITGGGDDIVARRNYDRVDTHLKTDFTPFVLGNDDLMFDANDANETRLQFSSVVQFKTQEEINAMRLEGRDELEMSRYRLDDSSIKDTVKTNDWKLATIALISQYYAETKISIVREIDTEANTLLNDIKNIFEFVYTPDKETDENMLPTKEVYSHLPDYANKKVKAELNAMNIFDKKIQNNNSKYKSKHCFVGIKLKPIVDIPTAKAVSYPN